MAESAWDDVTYLRKKQPKSSQMRSQQASIFQWDLKLNNMCTIHIKIMYYESCVKSIALLRLYFCIYYIRRINNGMPVLINELVYL